MGDGTRRSTPTPGTGHLEETLSTLVTYTAGGAVPAQVVINPLLEVWDAAHEIAAEVSVPVEVLLTSAVQRPSLQPDELISCIEEVWALAVQESVFSEPVHG